MRSEPSHPSGVTAPFSKGGAPTGAGIWKARGLGPKVLRRKTLGLFLPGGQKKRRSRPISRVLSWTVIPLGAASPQRSSNLPGPDAGHAIRSLFGLAPGGVCRTGLLPDSRCALTAPFHPYRPPERDVGGIFLLHFPSARAAQALPGTLPCGARTFLGIPEGMTRLSGRLRRAYCRTSKASTADHFIQPQASGNATAAHRHP